MRVDAFDFDLPPERIAQTPAERREDARLLVLDRATGAREHDRVTGLTARLAPGDLLVLNDARVLPARLHGRKESGGRVELLLVEPAGATSWDCMLRAARKPAAGATLRFPAGLTGTVEGRSGDRDDAGGDLFRIAFRAADGDVAGALERAGRMPLPPYIRRDAEGDPRDALDRERYQTVFAGPPGAVAAPTAGLHFSGALLDALAARGVHRATVTLHVGPGTFRPVRGERVEDHRMHAERFEIPEATAEAIARTRAAGRRVVAVGTTVTRALESRADPGGTVRPGPGRSDLFIVPGYAFRVIDALLTNFHLPRSTLLMLVSAFAGRERVLDAYRDAVERGYRFFSYGDAMFIR